MTERWEDMVTEKMRATTPEANRFIYARCTGADGMGIGEQRVRSGHVVGKLQKMEPTDGANLFEESLSGNASADGEGDASVGVSTHMMLSVWDIRDWR